MAEAVTAAGKPGFSSLLKRQQYAGDCAKEAI
jgi:hypothetical protein